MRVIGFDPAPKNFGFAELKIFKRKGVTQLEILRLGYLQSMIPSNYKQADVVDFSEEIHSIIDGADIVGFERFKLRITRFMSGEAPELVNVMIGLLLAQRNDAVGVLASSWKRSCKTLPLLYKQSTKKHGHIADALCIGLYAANSLRLAQKELGYIGKSLYYARKQLNSG